MSKRWERSREIYVDLVVNAVLDGLPILVGISGALITPQIKLIHVSRRIDHSIRHCHTTGRKWGSWWMLWDSWFCRNSTAATRLCIQLFHRCTWQHLSQSWYLSFRWGWTGSPQSDRDYREKDWEETEIWILVLHKRFDIFEKEHLRSHLSRLGEYRNSHSSLAEKSG